MSQFEINDNIIKWHKEKKYYKNQFLNVVQCVSRIKVRRNSNQKYKK